ncbi:hypothetical protein KTR66_04705 [Roseococcus sp. SDR]|uniref:hypothetical protein n=1 Tax=Roseococcus sp. SDR TaxID=2835532 RepID=UPI001BCA93A8|nr:hypothetical protein [Roseococcus sp. SDR]MBS7789280.1 hypothetical protein [Roseococcus sp. SDR]MBV1844594.1 hypothetical protein [Roseococcus sp. SDR]
MSKLVYLAEIEAYDPAISAVRTLRFASSGWAGTGAPGFFDGRIMGVPVLSRTAFAPGTTSGRIAQGIGALNLANPDGALDALADYGFDDRRLVMRVGEERTPYADMAILLTGTVEQASFTDAQVTLRLRDRLWTLDKPMVSAKYLGTNSGATGVEGTADTIKGQTKPRIFGRVINMAPKQVNVPAQIWQVSDGPVAAITAYEGGTAIATGAPYADLAALQATAPAAGQMRAWLGGGLFRLGSSPTFAITADVDEGALAADRTAAQVLSRLAAGPGGLLTDDIDAADVAALDAANAAQVGIWTPGDGPTLAAMEAIANSVGAWVGFDRLGKLRMRRLERPDGAPVVTFRMLRRGEVANATTADIIRLERVPLADQGRGVPTWQTTLRYARNWTPQRRNELTGAVTDARAAYLAEEWRSAVAKDEAVKVKHLGASDLTFDSLLISEADAEAEAARRQAMTSVRRDRLRLGTVLTSAQLAAVDLGSIVSVQVPRYGYAAGRLMVVIGLTMGVDGLDRPDFVTLDLWG